MAGERPGQNPFEAAFSAVDLHDIDPASHIDIRTLLTYTAEQLASHSSGHNFRMEVGLARVTDAPSWVTGSKLVILGVLPPDEHIEELKRIEAERFKSTGIVDVPSDFHESVSGAENLIHRSFYSKSEELGLRGPQIHAVRAKQDREIDMKKALYRMAKSDFAYWSEDSDTYVEPEVEVQTIYSSDSI